MTDSSWTPPDGGGRPKVALRILATIRMRIPPRKRKEARSILASLVERIKLEEGCLDCCLYQDALEGKILMFQELWADETGFKKHLRSDEFRHVLLVVEMANAPPEIRFDRIARSTDIASLADMPGTPDIPPDSNRVDR